MCKTKITHDLRVDSTRLNVIAHNWLLRNSIPVTLGGLTEVVVSEKHFKFVHQFIIVMHYNYLFHLLRILIRWQLLLVNDPHQLCK